MPADTYGTTHTDVARQIPARTRSGGGGLGDFSTTTEPSASRVDDLVQDAASDLARDVGTDLAPEVQDLAKDVIALGASLKVELGADDFNAERYDRLEKQYERLLADLNKAIADVEGGGEVGDDAATGSVQGSFPDSQVVWLESPRRVVAGTEEPWPL